MKTMKEWMLGLAGLLMAAGYCGTAAAAGVKPAHDHGTACALLPGRDGLVDAVRQVLADGGNGGIGAQVWAALVDRDGSLCAIVFSGAARGDQIPAGRLVSVQKAYTANASSVPGFAFSTANLYSQVQPGGMLYSLPGTAVLDAAPALRGHPDRYGTARDPLLGRRLGGSTVLAGGLALYDAQGRLLGGLGISGDLPCTDHIVAWKVRDTLALDFVPFGPAPDGSDNIVHDIAPNPAGGSGISASGWGYPVCTPQATEIAAALPVTHPLGGRE